MSPNVIAQRKKENVQLDNIFSAFEEQRELEPLVTEVDKAEKHSGTSHDRGTDDLHRWTAEDVRRISLPSSAPLL